MPKEEGTITIKLEGVSMQETERCRQIVHSLFEQGVFHLRNGKAILHFDHEATLQQIEFDYIRWRKNKSSPSLQEFFKNAIIESTQ